MGVRGSAWALAVGVLVLLARVEGHGRMHYPAGRSTAWRHGFGTPINYNDDELNCGGLGTQYEQNGGKCGVCGDNWADPQPRQNEAGGKYGTGVITANLKKGQELEIEVELTTTHQGHFEFRLCVNNDPSKIITDACLDEHVLQLADGSGIKYPIATENDWTTELVKVKLPQDVVCTQCVLQWHYRGGNNWGECGDGTEGMGCGDQEIFRACADISIQ
ncbi:uncharacterized protein LOC122251840 [Penaeus japonicus]|uniref:uncharacterized protein LOC122251840 n=1 Tax=Penaeus japonicus TaxID=27405 RepID=UPI001C7154C7|nr:uncharacterized protein LOC122251840 [Penaeus japonicus]